MHRTMQVWTFWLALLQGALSWLGSRRGRLRASLIAVALVAAASTPGALAGAMLRTMRAAVEISMYPLAQDYRARIRAFIDRIKDDPALLVRTNTLSTQLWGELDHVMGVLTREMSASAAEGAQLVFVLKVLPGIAAPPT